MSAALPGVNGISRSTVSHYLDDCRWQAVYPGRGVYATFTGPLSRTAELWATVLACGTGAASEREFFKLVRERKKHG